MLPSIFPFHSSNVPCIDPSLGLGFLPRFETKLFLWYPYTFVNVHEILIAFPFFEFYCAKVYSLCVLNFTEHTPTTINPHKGWQIDEILKAKFYKMVSKRPIFIIYQTISCYYLMRFANFSGYEIRMRRIIEKFCVKMNASIRVLTRFQ